MDEVDSAMKKKYRFLRCGFFLLTALFILYLPAQANPPDDPPVKKALTFWNAGKYNEALQLLNDIIRANPDDGTAYELRGNIYAFLNNFKKAIDDYTKAIELRPDLAASYYYRATIYTLTNNYAPAIKDYTRALELQTGYYEAYFHRGTIYSRSGNQQRAITDFTRVIELRPGYSEAYLYRGIALEETGKYDDALRDLNKALELNPRLEKGYIHRGNIYGLLENEEKARSDYKKANELSPYKAPVKSRSAFPKKNGSDESKKIKIIANTDSHRYHLPGMKYYSKVKKHHRVVFYSEQEAIAAGYRKAAN
jgi:tetratricopeptide (TPR) repeat protein